MPHLSFHWSRIALTMSGNRIWNCLLGSIIIASFMGSGVQADEPPKAAVDGVSTDVAMVQPLIVDRTVLVAKFDLAKIDMPEIGNAVQPGSSGSSDIVQQMQLQRDELIKLMQSLRTASGGQPIYMTAGIPKSEYDRPLFFAVENASEVDQPLLLDHLRIIGPDISAQVRDGKLIVTPVTEDKIGSILEALEPDSRKELSKAFEAVSSYPIQLLVLPPDYLRRTITELVPRLPDAWGGGSSEIFTEGVVWAAFGFDPAKLRAELVLQSTSEAAAERLVEHLPKMLGPGTLPRGALARAIGIDPTSESEEFASWLAAAGSIVEITRDGDRVVMRVEESKAVTAALPLLARTAQKFQERIRQSDHRDKFKRILLAMHNYHNTYKAFPPANKFRDDDGKSHLSWRVHLLPFLGEADLFQQFRLDEPWDSPHNSQLIDKMPEAFSSRLAKKPRETTFLAPVGEDTVFGGSEAARFQDVTDGTSNTAVLVEVQPALAVPWTAPQDYAFDPEAPGAGLQLDGDGKFLAGIMDGSVNRFRGDVTAELLLRLFRKSDGHPVDWDDFK